MVNENEIFHILKTDAKGRYEYSLKRIADNEELWIIGDDDGVRTYSDDNGDIVFPIWPYEEFAKLCCIEEYRQCLPEKLSLDEFVQEYLPDFEKNNYKLTLLPLPTDRGSIINATSFREDLDEELDMY